MRRTPLAVVVLATTLLTACTSSSSSKADAPTTSASSSPTSVPAPSTTAAAETCRLGAGYEPGTATHTMTVGGERRELIVHIPPEPKAGMRLVVDFHGATSNMQQQDLYTGFDRLADEEGFVVATPNGIDAPIRQ